jgi:hypothetical protein
MSTSVIRRLVAFLQRDGRTFCESCLTLRLMVASREAMREALKSDYVLLRLGLCPDCGGKKQVVVLRADKIAA